MNAAVFIGGQDGRRAFSTGHVFVFTGSIAPNILKDAEKANNDADAAAKLTSRAGRGTAQLRGGIDMRFGRATLI